MGKLTPSSLCSLQLSLQGVGTIACLRLAGGRLLCAPWPSATLACSDALSSSQACAPHAAVHLLARPSPPLPAGSVRPSDTPVVGLCLASSQTVLFCPLFKSHSSPCCSQGPHTAGLICAPSTGLSLSICCYLDMAQVLALRGLPQCGTHGISEKLHPQPAHQEICAKLTTALGIYTTSSLQA